LILLPHGVVSVAFSELNRAAARAGLRRLTDAELVDTGRNLRHLSDPAQQYGQSNPSFALQLREPIDEWRERRSTRMAGRRMCLCHIPGTAPITAHAQMLAAARRVR
jgi:hypothetical protein